MTLLRYSAHWSGPYSSMRLSCGLHCRTLDNVIKSVQRNALRIMLPDLRYAEAPLRTSLQSLSERRVEACRKFLLRSKQQEPMKSFLHSDRIQRDYSLRSGRNRSLTPKLNTERFSVRNNSIRITQPFWETRDRRLDFNWFNGYSTGYWIIEEHERNRGSTLLRDTSIWDWSKYRGRSRLRLPSILEELGSLWTLWEKTLIIFYRIPFVSARKKSRQLSLRGLFIV